MSFPIEKLVATNHPLDDDLVSLSSGAEGGGENRNYGNSKTFILLHAVQNKMKE